MRKFKEFHIKVKLGNNVSRNIYNISEILVDTLQNIEILSLKLLIQRQTFS